MCSHKYLYQVATHAANHIAGIEVPKLGTMLLELTRGTFPNSNNWIDIPVKYLGPRINDSYTGLHGWSGEYGANCKDRPVQAVERLLAHRLGALKPSTIELSTRPRTPNLWQLRSGWAAVGPLCGSIRLRLMTLAGRCVWRGGPVAPATKTADKWPPTDHSPPRPSGQGSWQTSASALRLLQRRWHLTGRPGRHNCSVCLPCRRSTLGARGGEGWDDRLQREVGKWKVVELSEAEKGLGKLAVGAAIRLRARGWRHTITEIRGRSIIAATVRTLLHQAAQVLHHLGQRGASVPMTNAPWSRHLCNTAVA